MPTDAENASSEASDHAPEAPTSSPSADHTASGPKPLSRNASRALVIGSILLAVAISAGGTWLILDMARSAPPSEELTVPSDTSDTSSLDTSSLDTSSLDTSSLDTSSLDTSSLGDEE